MAALSCAFLGYAVLWAALDCCVGCPDCTKRRPGALETAGVVARVPEARAAAARSRVVVCCH
eukprot:3389065-Alexandrium_andersonii.AAC.1